MDYKELQYVCSSWKVIELELFQRNSHALHSFRVELAALSLLNKQIINTQYKYHLTFYSKWLVICGCSKRIQREYGNKSKCESMRTTAPS